MQRFRWVQTRLLAVLALTALAAPQASAQYFYLPYVSRGPFMSNPMMQPYTPYSNYYYTYSGVPYVAPYPGYGILPPPFLTAGHYGSTSTTTGTANSYGYGLNGPARMRDSEYPAIPYEKSPVDRLTDLRRVHFEINVPFADAVVYVDGAKTKQTGLKRSFMTPPLQEDRYYTATVKVQWTDQFQKMRERTQTFNVVAGETVRHTFTE